MKIVMLIAFLGILASLGSALFFMMRDGRDGKSKTSNMARALTVRIGLSVVLFICVLIAWKLGYIHPTGLPVSG
ncbi:twin transmembrane helix small protein [Xylophilus sp. ASV27]|uniref:twin transmembrane helix small protein n=1 Tax=Xylophilus sp. ASV27 TaxID=2795129 RepID=UPI0018EC477B|nr:twin transmembrane helix small protein [Xylophilus sp. ASV27]